jgi:dTDP-glucose 4,6-dehydratase
LLKLLSGIPIAVLGSNSFAGASVVRRLLEDGADVVGFNRSAEGSAIFLQYRWGEFSGTYRFVKADINRNLDEMAQILSDFNPKVVVDFMGQGMVAESWHHPDQWYTTNVLSKVRLHEILRKLNGLERYIRISTPEVYGNTDTPISENWDFNPSTPYAVSHAATDMSLRAYNQHYGFPVIFARFANFYGPGQQLYRIVPRTIINALTGKKLFLHGGGAAVRAFIYATDIADGVARLISNGVPGRTYHFSPDEFYTIRDVVTAAASHLKIDLNSFVEAAADRPSKDRAYLMDASLAKRELGWKAKIDLHAGIKKTADWVKSNLDEIKTLPLDYVHRA